eukprot:SAG31_NODE_3612_length_4067_cov_13.889617_5_plen_84_part_00
MHYTGRPVFPFGTGLSFSKLSFAWASTHAAGAVTAPAIGVHNVSVTWHAGPPAEVVALGFVASTDEGADFPIKRLFDFGEAMT